MAAERKDPYRNFRFRVEIDGFQQGGFSDVSGYDATVDVIEYREGNQVTTVSKLPGLTKYGNITLKRGVTDSLELYNWLSECVSGKITRKLVTIIALDEEGNDVATWQVSEAWPTKYSAPDFKGTGNEVAIESLEIAHEGMQRTK
ncbi:phage tail protein [Bacillus horti]|uniref:Phage tail-like protein n=1 Tax=Caldalkalibacillus horti TaxID=77523 RepID=A0ABT9VZY0_9BACI|nr:phage tail protein [Bacillus horti]MDQ0166558.1 phage tail-like protein [Bacillus horti]